MRALSSIGSCRLYSSRVLIRSSSSKYLIHACMMWFFQVKPKGVPLLNHHPWKKENVVV